MLKIAWVDGKKLLRESFRNVKKDFVELQSHMIVMEEELRRLQDLVQETRRKPEEPRKEEKISESQPSLNTETLRLELRKIIQEEVREALKQQNTQAVAIVSENSQPETEPIQKEITMPIQEQILPPIPPRQKKKSPDNLKADLIKNYERNRKDIIKQQILGEAIKGGLTKIALRDQVVDQKKYCSKASFYRYMDELELQGLINYQRKKGKDVVQPLIS